MQLSWLRSTALVLVLVACGDDGGGDDGETKDDAAVTPKDSGTDSGSSSSPDTGLPNPRDSSVADAGTKPPVGDSGPSPVADAAVTDGGGSTGSDAGATDGGSTTPDAGATGESFAALYTTIFMPKCATAGCHGPTHRSGLFMNTVAAAHASLLKEAGADESGTGSLCKGQPKKRVAPGAPEQSLLVDMIAPPPHCGVQMPPDPAPKLTDAEQKRISDWIAQGAKNN